MPRAQAAGGARVRRLIVDGQDVEAEREHAPPAGFVSG